MSKYPSYTQPFHAILCYWKAYVNDRDLRINGTIYHDCEERFDDGTVVTTSPVHFGNIEAGSIVTTRSGTTYLLASKELSDTIVEASTVHAWKDDLADTDEMWARLQEKIAEHDQRLADVEKLAHRHHTPESDAEDMSWVD